MSITIDMSQEEIDAIKRLTRVESDGEAVALAAREFMRFARLRELKQAPGNVDYDVNAHRFLDGFETGDSTLPR